MSPSIRAELIIAARDEASATMRGVGGASKETGLSLLDLYAGVRLVEIGFRAAKGAYDEFITPSIKLADETRKLQFEIGATAEQAGKLIYAADQTGVSVKTLETGLKAAIRTMQSHKSEGIAPTIEGLGQLSDKYNAIQDPIARTTFLMHNFGRSGADLAPLMDLGSAGIKQLGDQASATGDVLDQKGVDSLHHLDQATKTLTDSMTGFKVAVAEEAAPALAQFFNDLTAGIEVQNNITKAQKAGIDTTKIVNYTYQDGIKIITNIKDANYELGLALGAVNSATDGVTDASDRAATSKQHLTDATEAVTAATKEEAAINKEQLDFMLKNGDATEKQITAYWKMVDAQQAVADKLALTAGISGRLTAAEANYGNTVEADTPKLAKLNAELARLEAAQGSVVTATAKGKMSQEDYQTLVDRTALSLAKYDEALASVGGKHAKSATTIEGLRITWQNYVNQLDDANGKVQTSSRVTVDNSTKIAALKAQIDPLIDAENKAKDAIAKVTEQMIFQAVEADLPIKAQVELAHRLGMTSDADYNLIVSAQAIDAQRKAGNLTVAEEIAGLVDLKNKEDALYDKSVTIDVFHNDHWNSTGGGNQEGGGGQSGPGQPPPPGPPAPPPPPAPPGQGGGGPPEGAALAGMMTQIMAIQNNMPSQIARAVRDAMQTGR